MGRRTNNAFRYETINYILFCDAKRTQAKSKIDFISLHFCNNFLPLQEEEKMQEIGLILEKIYSSMTHTHRPRLGLLLSAKILSKKKNVRSREPQNKMLYARKFLIPTDAAKLELGTRYMGADVRVLLYLPYCVCLTFHQLIVEKVYIIY